MNTRRKGREGEEKAVEFLKKQGYGILSRNFASRHGEIDIVARKGREIVFVEVKMRSSTVFGYPAEAVTCRKAERLRRTAMYYLMKNRIEDAACRFEVVSVMKTGPDYAIDIIPME